MTAGHAPRLLALRDVGEVRPGDDLPALLARAIETGGHGLQDGDILVVAQKVVSKAEGRVRRLVDVRPSARAIELAERTGKDARLVELVLSESTEVLRVKPGVMVVRHRLGLVMAQAGIDRSNVAEPGCVLLLPLDPDASAARLRAALAARFGIAPGVVVSDSFGRPWRLGTTNVAIGACGVPVLWNRRGEADRSGRRLESTEVAWADAVASAAGLVMGEAAEGVPAVLVRGLAVPPVDGRAADLVRPLEQDMFR